MHFYDNSSLIFPVMHPLPQVLGKARLKAEVMAQIQSDTGTSDVFLALPRQAQEAFLGFCMGNRGLKVTYDPFFLHIFDPAIHPGRLDRLLSCILGQNVTVKEVLPREHRRISEDSSLIIMDILAQISDDSLVNVEMQRIGYDFPVQRSFCYGADLLVRQYDMVRESYKNRKQTFSYRHIKPVCVIVIMEESSPVFHQYPDQYIHRSRFIFDSGLKMEQPEKFIYISLDIFRQMVHNELTELEAWMYFLGSDHPGDILRIIEKYPFFQELYQDIVKFRYQPKELITMFSEALRIMDQNAIEYMVDELKEEMSRINSELEKKTSELEKLDFELSKKDSELLKKDSELSKKDSELSEKDSELSEKNSELSKKNSELLEKEHELQKQKAEIKMLRALLKQNGKGDH